jgi:hypothetical protein
MPKRFIPPSRRSGNRDAKLIIIASEGTNTEKKYFDDLVEEYRVKNIHVEVLPRIEGGSDPQNVIKVLDNFRKHYSLRLGYDELWLVIDVDRWGNKKLAEAGSLCTQKNYGYAVSNPCFEIWLLLHIKSLDEYSKDELQKLKENKRANKNARTYLELEIVSLIGSYNKSDLDTSEYIKNVKTAISRAKKLDINLEHRWVNDLGTRVYLIAEKIITSK